MRREGRISDEEHGHLTFESPVSKGHGKEDKIAAVQQHLGRAKVQPEQGRGEYTGPRGIAVYAASYKAPCRPKEVKRRDEA